MSYYINSKYFSEQQILFANESITSCLCYCCPVWQSLLHETVRIKALPLRHTSPTPEGATLAQLFYSLFLFTQSTTNLPVNNLAPRSFKWELSLNKVESAIKNVSL